jgi:hypothetical protein
LNKGLDSKLAATDKRGRYSFKQSTGSCGERKRKQKTKKEKK